MQALRIGMIGCGVVGQGVLNLLTEHATNIEARLGRPVEVRRAVVRDGTKPRGPHATPDLLTNDVEQVLGNPDIDVVVEVMGGVDPAAGYVRRALDAGKPVVTANKALIADQGHELLELSEEHGVDLYFEAAVAGGIPVIRVLREALASDRVTALRGIINGTSNYILSQMQEAGMDFATALAEAQDEGFAEADPALDVGGGDAAHKLTILATLAYGARIDGEVPMEGIERVAPEDIDFARRFGYVVRPLAVARQLEDGALDLRVHPALVDRLSPLANIHGALNAVHIQGAALGPCLLSGAGAGALPTAVSVVSDVVDVGRNLSRSAGGRVPQRAVPGARITRARVQPLADHRCRFYLRFSVRDQSGVLGRLATGLGERNVSIEQMVQEGHGASDPVTVVLLTHPAREGDVRQALSAIDAFDEVVEPTRVLRVEEG